MRSRAGVGVLCAALAALCCATAQAGVGISYPQGPDPLVKQWPSWPDRVACANGSGIPFDPVAAFSGPTVAEQGAGEPEAALRKLLAETLDTGLPQRFWRLVALSDTRAEFASGRLEQDLFWLVFEKGPTGWAQVGEKDECRPRSVRPGLVAATWRFQPGAAIGPRSKRIRVMLSGPVGCHGKTPLSGMVEDVDLRTVRKRISITVWIDPPEGPQTCPKPAEQPVEVRLPGRLGKRSLWDGSSYPPRLRQ